MQANINVPAANDASQVIDFDPGDALCPGKSSLNIMWNIFPAWIFPAFFMQIERNLRGTIAFVRDQEKFLFGFTFELNPKSLESKRGTFPAAPSIGRVASLNFNADAPQHIAIEGEHAHQYSEPE